ncbi:TPA: phosphoethanolamine transferase [Morganella morganii]|nr:phosphoethanolamine transferase [Morganella morganii]
MIVFSMLNQSPATFFKELIDSSMKVKDELVKINKIKPRSDWGISSLNRSMYNNYILIIGESARKDYHNAYGYPINNTPFMSSGNGHLVNGLTSGGNNTVSSLRLMLTKPDVENWEPNYNLNIIDLAKSAGIKTYWISNQGFSGVFDTPISVIANRSDYKFFLKYGSFSSKNTDDILLLDELNKIISTNKNEKKLIVIHLYGSHPNPCDRINGYDKITNVKDNKYYDVLCYITSIKKTDDFIKNTNEIMEKSNETYSVLYFSDHGMGHLEDENGIFLKHVKNTIFNYEIPLYKISSDDHNRVECTSFKSGLNFLDGIATWIGIKNINLTVDYDLFNCKSDSSDYGLKEKIDSSMDDMAIDIRGK